MARIRTIKPEFFTDEKIGALEPLARLLYIGLWGIADVAGRLAYKPGFFKVTILPYDTCDIHFLLDTLHQQGFIEIYVVAGIKYARIPKFKQHQRITGKEAETPSLWPPPPSGDATSSEIPEKCPGNTRETPEKHPGNTRDTVVKRWMSGKGREGKGTEGKGTEGKGENRVLHTPHTTHSTFTQPTTDKLAAYCLETTINIDQQKFLDYYNSNGWRVGKNPMKDWKAAVRNWHRNDQNKTTGGTNGHRTERPTTSRLTEQLAERRTDQVVLNLLDSHGG